MLIDLGICQTIVFPERCTRLALYDCLWNHVFNRALEPQTPWFQSPCWTRRFSKVSPWRTRPLGPMKRNQLHMLIDWIFIGRPQTLLYKLIKHYIINLADWLALQQQNTFLPNSPSENHRQNLHRTNYGCSRSCYNCNFLILSFSQPLKGITHTQQHSKSLQLVQACAASSKYRFRFRH